MKVQRIVRAESHRRQCSLPKSELNPGSIGYKGYREKRAGAHSNPETCLRDSQWLIDGKPYCTQHAGIKALEHLSACDHVWIMTLGGGYQCNKCKEQRA